MSSMLHFGRSLTRTRFSTLAFTVLAGFVSVAPARAATSYTWHPVSGNLWSQALNWTPNRTSPATDDILIFDDGGDHSVTVDVVGQTIGQFLISDSTRVLLSGNSGTSFTIGGLAGTDLDVPAGTRLDLFGQVTVNLGPSATGAIGGRVSIGLGAPRLRGSAVNSLVFQNGSLLQTTPDFGTSPFGTTAFNSVLFENGSLYVQSGGGNPFGATQPNSVVTFAAGSRFRLDSSVSPPASGRTYADFEYNNSGTASISGSSLFQVDNLTVSQGTFNVGMTGPVNIRGNITATGFLNFNPASGTPVYRMSGTSPQTISFVFSGPATFSITSNVTLEIDNPAGVEVTQAMTTPATVSFVNGSLRVSQSFRIDPPGNVIGASASTGWVDCTPSGRLQLTISPGQPSRTYPVGTGTYTPVTAAFHGVTGSFVFSARPIAGEHPTGNAAQLDLDQSVNRFYATTFFTDPTGMFTDFDLTLNFASGDIDPGADPATFVVRRWDPTPRWNATATGTRSATSTQSLGNPPLSPPFVSYNWAVGEPATPVLSIGNVAQLEAAGPMPFPVRLSQIALDTVSVDYLTGDGTATGANDDYEPATGSLTFIPGDTVHTVAVIINDDSTTEPDEEFTFTILNAVGAPIADASGAGTILNDDAVAGVVDALPASFELRGVTPNPASDIARIGFALPHEARVRLTLHDLQGRNVTTILDASLEAGFHEWPWRVSATRPPAGIYWVRLTAGPFTSVRRVAILD